MKAGLYRYDLWRKVELCIDNMRIALSELVYME